MLTRREGGNQGKIKLWRSLKNHQDALLSGLSGDLVILCDI
jgi:hypothetical protein